MVSSSAKKHSGKEASGNLGASSLGLGNWRVEIGEETHAKAQKALEAAGGDGRGHGVAAVTRAKGRTACRADALLRRCRRNRRKVAGFRSMRTYASRMPLQAGYLVQP